MAESDFAICRYQRACPRDQVRSQKRLPVGSLSCPSVKLLTPMMKRSQSLFHIGENQGLGVGLIYQEDCKVVLITKGFGVQSQEIGPVHFSKKLIRSRTDITRTETHSQC